ncbi:hypothetical protein ACGFI3_46100 [Nonomuraea wenchangensis]|uniref:hypothetical protein n=1 Tax=Nonomuraea wenchangensis TaxID=568860 RepID=UPI003713C908
MAISDLLTAAGLTVDRVLRACPGQVSRSTLYDWRNGQHLPDDSRPLRAIVEFCLPRARGAPLGTAPGRWEDWLVLLGEAAYVRDARARGEEPGPSGARRLVNRWDPLVLGVHQAVGGGAPPAYVRRAHDDLLEALLDPGTAANRLVVVRGTSSTGKSRAAYQAAAARLPNWPVLYPRTAAELTALLHDARTDSSAESHNAEDRRASLWALRRTVLWLNELRHYADDPAGPDALYRLAGLLTRHDHVIVITSLWPEHWSHYMRAAPAVPGAPDPARPTRELLAPLPRLTTMPVDPARGGVVVVPDQFTHADLERAWRLDDPVLNHAIDAAQQADAPGRVAQYLAGAFDLLAHYQGPSTPERERPGPPEGHPHPYGWALITAAMDAARLGRTHPLSRDLLQSAAVAYLAPHHRALPEPQAAAQLNSAWEYVTRTLKGAIQALQPIPPDHGFGVIGYRLADYLDQHGRRTRADQIPPRGFWAAAAAHAHPADLAVLGHAAMARGLFRDAAQLLKHATADSDPDAAIALVSHMHALHPADQGPADLAAARAALDNPVVVADLWRTLHEVGAHDQATALLARNPATHVALNNLSAVLFYLLPTLLRAGAREQAATLVERATAYAALNDAYAVAALLRTLREAGAHSLVTALLARDPATHAARTALDNPHAVVDLLEALLEAGAHEQAATLVERVVALNDRYAVALLRNSLEEAGAHDQAAALNSVIRPVSSVAELVAEMEEEMRKEIEQGTITWHSSTQLVLKLPTFGTHDQEAEMAEQVVLRRSIVAQLLDGLLEIGTHDREAEMAEQVADAVWHGPRAMAWLIHNLREAGAHDQATALTARLPVVGLFNSFLTIDDHWERFRFGREPDGSAAAPWGWDDLEE